MIVTVPNGYGPWQLSVKVEHKLGRLISQNAQLGSLFRDDVCVQSVNAGEGSVHVQFFTRKQLHQIFLRARFRIIASGSSDFIANVTPFRVLISKSKLLCRIDFALADMLPSVVASGWYFTLEK
jgi:hypothetical protein